MVTAIATVMDTTDTAMDITTTTTDTTTDTATIIIHRIPADMVAAHVETVMDIIIHTLIITMAKNKKINIIVFSSNFSNVFFIRK